MVLVEGEEEGAESERKRERERRRISHVIIMDWQAKRWRKEEEEEVVVARRVGGQANAYYGMSVLSDGGRGYYVVA